MAGKYPEYDNLNLPATGNEILGKWDKEQTFKASISTRAGKPTYTFYEGPPSANGLPGIHHVMSRAIKDIFCRYKTLKGFLVERKGGWDTHGLPIELSVEKTLGIRKDDIGKKISIEEYNKACRQEVMKYKDVWDDLTRKMGYWVDLDHPYITFTNDYIESCWWLLKEFYKKDLLYEGYTIQPYSPAAGTGLSSHELNQPGTYKMVKDTTVVAMFKIRDTESGVFANHKKDNRYFLAWTTTPWTLPSNTALAVGKGIDYVEVETFNQYTFQPISVILANDLFGKYFPEKNAELKLEDYKPGDKAIPYKVIAKYKGKEFEGVRYEQLLPYTQPSDGDAFKVVLGDFVTTEDGTGIVHIAPSFGADDFRTAKQQGLGSLTLVDKQGRFTSEVTDFAGEFVKEQYLNETEKETERAKQGGDKYLSVDERISIKLKKENKAFKVEKYEHTYPHCWRTDKPVLYYPLDSWFIRTTAKKDRMVELNKTINWKPESTGTGRFGNWLENLVDWNLSRSRFWGIPLPIWISEDRTEQVCIGSVAELNDEIEKSIKAGWMKENPLKGNINPGSKDFTFDLHRPYVDDIFLASPSGKKMIRESDLIDVWFDSGSMPYAQWHYPFENKEKFATAYPADYIAEGVDQTRGWFFTLHAIAVMLFDSVAFKNVVSNGLVLDKNGNKMSKRLGNAADPFEIISKYGADATRWYMISNAQPWDNLKFNVDGITEVQRKFFGTLYNTYSFFALYANIDGFHYAEKEIPVEQRTELDQWILSELNSLILIVDECYADYEPTKAARAISDFVSEYLSNWYVRLSRRRFWKGEYSADKIAAYQTLYTCLESIAIMMSPIAPFYSDRLFSDLNNISKRRNVSSVHLADFPSSDPKHIDKSLESKMELAQQLASMVLSLRKKVNIRVRQPLRRIMLPVLNPDFKKQVESVQALVLAEVNVKEIEFISDTEGILVRKIRPNFKVLGKKVGPLMKDVATAISFLSQEDIQKIEQEKSLPVTVNGNSIMLDLEDVEILSEDIPGWQVASEGRLTVALDTTITADLKEEGIAREFVNRVQNLRKDKGFEVTDRIDLQVLNHAAIRDSLINNKEYICAEILAASLNFVDQFSGNDTAEVEVDEHIKVRIFIKKHEASFAN